MAGHVRFLEMNEPDEMLFCNIGRESILKNLIEFYRNMRFLIVRRLEGMV